MFFHSFVASQAHKVSFQKRELRKMGCLWCRQDLHHAAARERFESQNRKKMTVSERCLKLSVAEFAPRCGARAGWKSKSLKPTVSGRFLTFKLRFAWKDFSALQYVSGAVCLGSTVSWHAQYF